MTHNMMFGPYTNHYREMGEPIRQTTSFWQDALTRIYLGRKHQERLQYAENALRHVSHCFDMAPPQTFGELCLEIYQDRVMNFGNIVPRLGLFYLWDWPLPGELHAIRTAMYHRHTDPKRERLYRLKDLIANA